MNAANSSRREPMYSSKEFATALGIHIGTFRNWIKAGKIPSPTARNGSMGRENFKRNRHALTLAPRHVFYWPRSVVLRIVAEQKSKSSSAP